MNGADSNTLLNELRRDLDEIDWDIASLLNERFTVCSEIAKEKRIQSICVENRARETEVYDRVRNTAADHPERCEAVYREIIRQSKKLQKSELNLYLVGMPNCGKTKMAGRLSAALDRECVDTDLLIMNDCAMTIDDIFDRYGEDRFRQIEHEMLKRTAAHGSLIVATGGGVLTYSPNIDLLKGSGIIVFLDRSPDRLVGARVRNRPLIRGGAEAVLKLYRERIADYRGYSDLSVDPDERESVGRIKDFFLSRIK